MNPFELHYKKATESLNEKLQLPKLGKYSLGNMILPIQAE